MSIDPRFIRIPSETKQSIEGYIKLDKEIDPTDVGFWDTDNGDVNNWIANIYKVSTDWDVKLTTITDKEHTVVTSSPKGTDTSVIRIPKDERTGKAFTFKELVKYIFS